VAEPFLNIKLFALLKRSEEVNCSVCFHETYTANALQPKAARVSRASEMLISLSAS